MKSARQTLRLAAKQNKEPKLSRTHAPVNLSPVEWQRGLRRQFGREQSFGLENLGSEPFFSEFRVSNPVSKSSYRVAIRGLGPGGNFCSCPDYATSELGRSEVLRQLASRTDQNLLVPMTEMQMVYHQENADEVAKIVRRWRKTKFLSDKDQRRLMIALQNMRMSCNSTYLLDQETDHGVKADELAALFDKLFAEPEAKAVVFSQWTRTHDIVIRRLEARKLGYVSFHGGVPSEKRPALIERFRDDPACRVFLSTDAGSTGLNLQHASTVVNMDLPWNPAILEQRIARIHRMGQTRPVQVINFVAKGTIEEGMLSTLAFKRSLSAGLLDGGSGEISLGGSRLNRFMKDVESVTGNIGEGEAVTAAEEVRNIVTADGAAPVDGVGVDEKSSAEETATA